MAINSKKANEIDAYINSHECKKGKQKVVINGKVELLESYAIPTSLLQYNHDNRRFNLEIQEEEIKLGRKLDPTSKDDVRRIKELLLLDQAEAKKLKDDLKRIGEQTEVGAVSFDGVVINGNRRMATLEELYSEDPNKKWENLWAVRLPKDISEKDLWRIEAGLQLSKEKVADYGPVNNLLMISEGKKAGLSHSEIASSMYGWTDKQVAADLERLDLIDIFLQFFGQPKNYGLIKRFRLHEHFIDIQKGLVQKLKDSGAAKKELTKKLETVFVFLKANIDKPDTISITHYDVRNICKILHDEKSTYALTDSFEEHKDIRKVPIEKLVDNLDKAIDVKKNRDDKEKPGKLIDRAISALNNIDRRGKHFKEEEVKRKLKELDSIIKEMKTQLGIK
ncbi:MAG: hypothetical protein JSS90_09415 [Bacteroidetes bacterium]|jgi:hypothetical protein|nr:hypothetical protein [Bacteroidota bacterium]